MANYLQTNQVAIQGQRSTKHLLTGESPGDWRRLMGIIDNNSDYPFTALTNKLKSEKAKAPRIDWWLQSGESAEGTISGVYTDAACTTPVAGAITITSSYSASHYIEIDADSLVKKEVIKPGLMLLCYYAADTSYQAQCVVTAINDAIATVKFISSAATIPKHSDDVHTVGDMTKIFIIGTSHPEGDTRPLSIGYSPVSFYNLTQIFRDHFSITRTQMELMDLRTGDPKTQARMNMLRYHGAHMENAFFFGRRTDKINSTTNQPERTMMGIRELLETYVPLNIADYSAETAADYAGFSWNERGMFWLEDMFERIFAYGSSRKLCFAGNGAIKGINRAAAANSQVSIEPGETKYGIKVKTLITPFGELDLATHQGLSRTGLCSNDLIIIEPEQIVYKYVTDTKQFKDDRLSAGRIGESGVDAYLEEVLTECTLQYLNPFGFGWLKGVGLDNAG